MNRRFTDRSSAGRELADALGESVVEDPVVLGLPRGGVPVAYEVARSLKAPLDILVVRKVGVPGHKELSMGAIGSGGVFVRNDAVIRHLGIDETTLVTAATREAEVLKRLEHDLRGAGTPVDVADRDVIVVDDGVATGATMRAAIAVLRTRKPKRITVAVPVAPPEVCDLLIPEVDDLICLLKPETFMAVGLWYRDFGQTSTDEVRRLLEESAL